MVGLCDRFKCLPSQLYQEDAELVRMLAILAKGQRDQEGVEYG